MHVHLETARLVLCRFTPADVDLLVALDADPEVMRFLTGGRPTPREVVEREKLPKILGQYAVPGGHGRWAAHERGSGDFLGWFALDTPDDDRPAATHAELGYRLRRAAWGRGYATEGSRALLRLAFRREGFAYVFAQTMAVNLASRRVMEKVGLRLARTFHADFPDPIPGAEHGEVEYALSRQEWERQQEAAGGTAPGRRDGSTFGG